jgi:hypothetical protein
MASRVGRRKPRIDSRRIGSSADRDSYRFIINFYNREIEPIIKLLTSKDVPDTLIQSLRKYTVIALISSFEYFFKNEARRTVDENELNTDALFEGKISFTVDELNELAKENKLTKGNIVASSFSFVNLDVINWFFSKLLNLDFLDYVKKLNDIDQTRQIFNGPPIPLEYSRLYQAYQIRNDIVHDLKTVHLTKTKVIEMWDSALNIIEIGQKVIDRAVTKEGRAEIDQDYQRGLTRQKTRDLYRFRSEKLMLQLLESEIQLTKRQNLTMAELGIGDGNEIVDGTIKTMLKKKLIEIDFKNVLRLTSKGQRTAKKVKNTIKNMNETRLGSVNLTSAGLKPSEYGRR